MKRQLMRLSIIVPVYGCKNCLKSLVNRVEKSMENIKTDFEIILVDDGSSDGAWEEINALKKRHPHINAIKLSRNFGQHTAISAGLDYARGEWIVVMDCDLQDQPEEIEKLILKTKDGYDVVFALRNERQDSFWRKLCSRLFYVVFNYLSDCKFDYQVANFGIYSRRVINEYKRMGEQGRNFPAAIAWLGFPTGYIKVHHSQRHSGKTSYNLIKLLNFAVNSAITHSNKPLYLLIKLGLLLSISSFIFGVFLIIHYLTLKVPLGWTSVMVSIWFFSGLFLANLGILGLYLGKIFDETKHRPLYVVSDLIGVKNKYED
jgi:dolichol-phosphate mannosyltransferase